MDTIKKISKNTTIIISTHDEKMVKISDQIILLKDKKIFNIDKNVDFKLNQISSKGVS